MRNAHPPKITAAQIARVTDASSDMIGRVTLLYHAGDAMHPATTESHIEELHRSFARVAAELGYRIARIDDEPELVVGARILEAAE